MTKRRLLLLLPFLGGVLAGQVELETQISMGTGGPSGKLVPLRTERHLYQDGALRTESGDWFVLLRPVNGTARVYVVNRKERKIAEGTIAELLESIRLRTPAPEKLAEQLKIASAPATPAAPAILWQGKTLPGQACKLRIEMTGLSTPLTMEQTIETYTTELEGELAASESARGSMGMTAQTQMVMPGFSAGDRIAATLADCFPQGRFLVRMEMTASSKALPVQTSVRYEVTKLRTGVRADAALFTPTRRGRRLDARESDDSVHRLQQRATFPGSAGGGGHTRRAETRRFAQAGGRIEAPDRGGQVGAGAEPGNPDQLGHLPARGSGQAAAGAQTGGA